MKKIALVVGHKSTSTGARNEERKLSEWEFNARLALDVWGRFQDSEIECAVIHRRTYKSLPGDVNAYDPDLVVLMHANASFNHDASGSEVLYYHRSEPSAVAAAIFQDNFLSELNLRDRGIKGIDSEARGGLMVAGTRAKTVLCEPFFIDFNDDLVVALSSDLTGAYEKSIRSVLE